MFRTATASTSRRPSRRHDLARRFRLEALEERVVPHGDPLPFPVGVADANDAQQVLVGRVYQDLLNRLPEPDGLAYWSGALHGGASLAQVADAIAGSAEYERLQIQSLYLRLLGRTGDDAGMQAFTGLFAHGGTLAQAQAIVAASAEFYAGHGSTPTAWLEAVSQDALGRAPTAAEEAAAAGADRTVLAASLYSSAAAVNHQVDEVYHHYLARAGDTPGLAYWGDRLVEGTPLGQVVAALAGSAEYAGLKTPLGAVLSGDGSDVAVPEPTFGTLGGGIGTEDHLVLSEPLVFQAFTPCRFIDTRPAFPPINMDGIMAPGETRTFDILSFFGDCGSTLPSGTIAISATLFVVGSTNPSGHWIAYPADLAAPNAASVYSDHAGAIIASNIVVTLAQTGPDAGKIKIFSGPGGHVVLDINGVYLRSLRTGDQLQIQTVNGGSAAILGQNNSTAAGSHGIGGFASGAGPVYGVQGQAGSGSGVNSSGVHGISPATPAFVGQPGVRSGVLGRANNFDIPVVGIGDFEGVRGINTSGNSSTVASFGSLGFSDTTAVFASGNISGTGTKGFVDPHPTDPSKMIRYVALEGPEVGTYFRGTGHFVNGHATIDVPESFRISTETLGLTVQITPVGALALTAVETLDLNHVSVLGSQDIDFFYQVNGVRTGYASYQAVLDVDRTFLPNGPDATLPTSLTPLQRQRLIDNGTYNADGTVNLTTAHRLGWDLIWAAPTP